MTMIKAKPGEVLESVLRRWKRAVEKKGTLKELRKREFHQKNATLKQRLLAAAVKRWKKKLAKEMQMFSSDRSSSSRGKGAGTGARGRSSESSSSSSSGGGRR